MSLSLTAYAAWWFLPFVVPIAIWVAWSDMATMKIPNKSVLALLVVFIIIGLIALPISVYPWRFLHFAVILALGFVINSAGLLGAGDAKFAAAMAPFVAIGDLSTFLYLFAPVVIAAYIVHRFVRRMPSVRAKFPNWESWERKDFPLGLALGPGLVFYLIAGAIWGA